MPLSAADLAVMSVVSWQTMTAVVNEMKSPNSFLKDFLWSAEKTVPTESIEIDTITKGRFTAPFVRVNGEAKMVTGYGETKSIVQAPNIRIKKPESPSNLLYRRTPGSLIYVTNGQTQLSAAQQTIARNLQIMNDYIANTEEWMCAQALVGSIAYSVAGNDVFTITFPKPAGNNVTLSTFWDDATPANVHVEENFLTAKRLVANEVGLGLTDAIMGQSAAQYFLRCLKASGLNLTTGLITAGQISLEQQFTDKGVLYMGRFAGLNCWEYSRTVSFEGVDTDMIRSKYVEFVSTSQASERVMHYASIADFHAVESGQFETKRFAKSWIEQDPSVYMQLVSSRPLPVPRRPGATVSMKVISG